MSKRGISNLISIVLLVGITISIAGIVSLFVKPSIIDTIETTSNCGDVKLILNYGTGFLCSDDTSNLVIIPVLRGNDNLNLSGFQLKLINKNGEGKTVEIINGKYYTFIDRSDMPTANTQKVYILNLSVLNISDINDIEIAPVIKNKACDLRPTGVNIEGCSKELKFEQMEIPSYLLPSINWSDLIEYFSFDQGNVSHVFSPVGNNGTALNYYGPNGSFEFVAGKIGNAIQVSNNSFLEVYTPNPEGLMITPGSPVDQSAPKTIALWINPKEIGGIQEIVYKRYSYEIRLDNDEVSASRVECCPTSVWGTTADINLINNNWYFIAVTHNYTTARIHINGEERGSVMGGTGGSTFPLHLGSRNHYDSIIGFKGVIDEFMMWNRVLNSTEIVQLYNNGNGRNYTG